MTSSLSLIWSRAEREIAMPPGSAKVSIRAATLTPFSVQVIAFDDHVAQVDSDPQRKRAVVSKALLDGRSAFDGFDDGCEFRQIPVTHRLESRPR